MKRCGEWAKVDWDGGFIDGEKLRGWSRGPLRGQVEWR